MIARRMSPAAMDAATAALAPARGDRCRRLLPGPDCAVRPAAAVPAPAGFSVWAEGAIADARPPGSDRFCAGRAIASAPVAPVAASVESSARVRACPPVTLPAPPATDRVFH